MYTIEPSSAMLVPQLRFGKMETRSMSAVKAQADGKDPDLVTVAYHNDEPVTRGNVIAGFVTYTCIAGVFGFTQRIGVLFAELPQVVFQGQEDLFLIHFKACAQALNDALALR